MAGRDLLCRRRGRLAPSTVVVLALAASGIGALAVGAPAGTRITDVAVQDRGGDATAVVVTFDGSVAGHRRFHMNGEAPRALLRIAGIVEAYRPYEVPVDDGRVRRVRIGHHPEFDPPEEHLVFDLIDGGVAITRVEEQGRVLTVVLERVGASGPVRPPPPVRPTQAPVRPTAAPPVPTPTPTPSVTPTATVPPPPPATPTLRPPTPTASAAPPPPTPTPPAPRLPPRGVSPTPATPAQGVSVGPRATSSPRGHRDFSGPLLTEVVVAHRDDGSALVRVSADNPIDNTEVRYLGVRGAPPRNILSMVGVGLPGEDAVLRVRDGLLCEIQVVFRADAQPPRTELTLFLASVAVKADRAAAKGAHVVVHLTPPDDRGAALDCEVESTSGTRRWRFTASGPPSELPAGPR